MRLLTILGLFAVIFAAPAQAELKRDIAYGKDRLQKLDVYTSSVKCPLTGCPVLVFVHGGGWANGSKDMRRTPIGPNWSARGAIVVSLDYRLSPEVMHPAHVQDIASGIAWVYNNIRKYGGNPNRIFLMGHSAGAHLVALVATDPQYLKAHGLSPVKNIAGVMPVDTASYDLAANDIRFVEGRIEDAFGTDPQVLNSASPLQIVKPYLPYPPFILAVVQERTTALEQTRALAMKLPSARVITRSYPGSSQLEAHGKIHQELADMNSTMTRQFMAFVGIK